jgi:Zn-finger nucleic acid-binding protein
MQSPVYPNINLVRSEVEPGLYAYRCPSSGGVWIPLESYLNWITHQQVQPEIPADYAPVPESDSNRKALICPESGRLLLRYRAGKGMDFHIDRSPATGGVWLDKGEWEALKCAGIHREMHLIFTASYQRTLRSSEYSRAMEKTFRERIGEGDFPRVAEFAKWLRDHARRQDICAYLFNEIEKSELPEAV